MLNQNSCRKRQPGRPRADIDNGELLRLYVDKRLSVRDVAERLGVSHQTVARRLSEADIPAKRWRLPGEN